MALRVLAVSLAVCGCVALAIGWLLVNEESFELNEESFEPATLRPSPDVVRPCLISVERCLELSDTPFAPCLVNTERCSQEWAVEPLQHPYNQQMVRRPREFGAVRRVNPPLE